MNFKAKSRYKLFAILLILLSICYGCETETDRNWELLTSSIWDIANDCNGPYPKYSVMYLFLPDGQLRIYGQGVLSSAGSWRLKDNGSTLIMGQNEYRIRSLTETEMVINARSDDFFVSICRITFRALPINEAATSGVSDLTGTSAKLHGAVRTSSSSQIVSFKYGTSTAYGKTIAADQNPAPGIKLAQTSALVSGLTPGTTYHFRITAVNSSGTMHGDDLTFRTFNAQTVTDQDNNIYNTVTIGTQVWMAENLKTTKYNDGTSIPLVTDNTSWGELTTPGYCWNNNDSVTLGSIYGALYNWFAVNTGKLCPTGWHVASSQEWASLAAYLGTNAGGKIREAGTGHWLAYQEGATNETGFSALPGGIRDFVGEFTTPDAGFTRWWTSTVDNEPCAWYYTLISYWQTYDDSSIELEKTIMLKKEGFSIRCIKD